MTQPNQFKQHNSPNDVSNFTVFLNFITLALNLLYYMIKGFIDKYFFGQEVTIGPLISFNENKPRYYVRYSNIKTSFSKLLDIMEEVKIKLKLPHIAYTINFSPKIGLGFLPNHASTKSQQKRLAAMTLPIDHPAPMDSMHVALLSTSLFYNNYGRFDPNITGNAVGFLWNWVGLEPNFCGFLVATSIKKKLFACIGLPHVHSKVPKINSSGNGDDYDDVLQIFNKIDAMDGFFPVKCQSFASLPPIIPSSHSGGHTKDD